MKKIIDRLLFGKDADQRSVELHHEYDRLLAEKPAVFAERDRRTKDLRPLAHDWMLAEATGDRHEPELRARLVAEREKIRMEVDEPHRVSITNAGSELEHLNMMEISKFQQRCRNLQAEIHKQRRGDVQRSTYDGISDQKMVVFLNNFSAVSEAQELIRAAEKAVGEMRFTDRPAIRAAIAEWDLRFAKIDTDVFASDQVSPSVAADLRERVS